MANKVVVSGNYSGRARWTRSVELSESDLDEYLKQWEAEESISLADFGRSYADYPIEEVVQTVVKYANDDVTSDVLDSKYTIASESSNMLIDDLYEWVSDCLASEDPEFWDWDTDFGELEC